jgi:hypothetical protein
LALADKNASDKHCNPEGYCDLTGLELRDSAVALGNAATAAYITGGFVLAGGFVLLLTAPSSSREGEKKSSAVTSEWSAGLEISPTGVRVRGTW